MDISPLYSPAKSPLNACRVQLIKLASCVGVAATLSACYVAPIHPTYPTHYPSSQSSYPQHAIVIAPPMPPAPPPMVTITARLYPVNPIASRAGMLTAIITDAGGRGNITLNFNGSTLQGEASRVADGAAFGHITREVLGTELLIGYNAQRGIANAYGPSAPGSSATNYAQCEYVISRQTPPTGTGACLFSNGAKYQLHFGG